MKARAQATPTKNTGRGLAALGLNADSAEIGNEGSISGSVMFEDAQDEIVENCHPGDDDPEIEHGGHAGDATGKHLAQELLAGLVEVDGVEEHHGHEYRYDREGAIDAEAAPPARRGRVARGGQRADILRRRRLVERGEERHAKEIGHEADGDDHEANGPVDVAAHDLWSQGGGDHEGGRKEQEEHGFVAPPEPGGESGQGQAGHQHIAGAAKATDEETGQHHDRDPHIDAQGQRHCVGKCAPSLGVGPRRCSPAKC